MDINMNPLVTRQYHGIAVVINGSVMVTFQQTVLPARNSVLLFVIYVAACLLRPPDVIYSFYLTKP